MDRRFAVLLALVAVVAGAAGALLVPKGRQTTARERFAYHQDVFTRTRRAGLPHGRPTVLQRLPFVAHGGVVAIQWYDGAWTPTRPRTGSYAGIWVDGVERASGLIGGNTGRFESRPAVVMWSGALPAGPHLVEVRVTRADRGFEVPRAAPARPIIDGVYVTEYTS